MSMIGKYVIVRCKEAGVHAGFLESYENRSCILTKSRRLWYWVAGKDTKFLSGVASLGLASNSKIGTENIRIMLTENCEIIECSEIAATSIQEFPYDKK